MPITAAAGSDNYSGMVWESHGKWYLNGSTTPIRLGEAIPPGGLLTAEAIDGAQSAVVLLPDGQRLLCECYEARVCAQGFRIPAITSPPTPAIWNMFVGVRNALLLRPATANAPFPPAAGRAALAANVEIVAPMQSGEVSIASALAALPSGRYTLTVVDDAALPSPVPAPSQPLIWAAPHGEATVRIPGPGVYRMRVADSSSATRMQIEVLATTPALFSTEAAGLKQVRATVRQWSSSHPGWSLHDFLRVYLESRAMSATQ